MSIAIAYMIKSGVLIFLTRYISITANNRADKNQDPGYVYENNRSRTKYTPPISPKSK